MAVNVQGVTGNLFSGLVSGAAVALLVIFLVIVLGGFAYYFVVYRRKFDIQVKVISDRATDPKVYFDKGASVKDKKTNTSYFKLLKSKVALPMPKFNLIESTNRGDYLELYRNSDDNWFYLTRPKINKEFIFRSDGKAWPMRELKQTQIETDAYWIIKRKEQNKKMLTTESVLMKLLEWAPQIMSGFFMLMILYVFMDKLPEILTQLRDLVSQLSTLQGVQSG